MATKSTLDGSPSCIQIAPETDPKDIDKFLNELNQSIEELDVEKFSKLKEKYPFVSEVGDEPFFEEIEDKIKTNLVDGNTCLNKTDGFCHNCLLNEPVKIFGKGFSKVGLYYHFNSDSPIEVHSCTFCFNYKDIQEQETEDENYTRIFSSKDRDPRMIEVTMKFGELIKQRRLSEAHTLFNKDIALEEISSESIFEGNEDVQTALINFENEYLDSDIEIKPRLLFYGINEEQHSDFNLYHGMPGFVFRLTDFSVMWLVAATDKSIYNLRSMMFYEGEIEKLDVITFTNHYF